MTNPSDATEVVPYLTSAATIVALQGWLKGRQFYQDFVTAFPSTDKYAHWLVAGAASLIASAGIHFVWSGTLAEGGTATFAVPGIIAIIHGVSDWFKVYILQHTIYKTTHQTPINIGGVTLVNKPPDTAVEPAIALPKELKP